MSQSATLFVAVVSAYFFSCAPVEVWWSKRCVHGGASTLHILPGNGTSTIGAPIHGRRPSNEDCWADLTTLRGPPWTETFYAPVHWLDRNTPLRGPMIAYCQWCWELMPDPIP